MKKFAFIANKVKQTRLIIDIKIQDSILIIDLTRREKKKTRRGSLSFKISVDAY